MEYLPLSLLYRILLLCNFSIWSIRFLWNPSTVGTTTPNRKQTKTFHNRTLRLDEVDELFNQSFIFLQNLIQNWQQTIFSLSLIFLIFFILKMKIQASDLCFHSSSIPHHSLHDFESVRDCDWNIPLPCSWHSLWRTEAHLNLWQGIRIVQTQGFCTDTFSLLKTLFSFQFSFQLYEIGDQIKSFDN